MFSISLFFRELGGCLEDKRFLVTTEERIPWVRQGTGMSTNGEKAVIFYSICCS